ncbi:MAG: hypothetical protein R3C31_14400 [Hyphomonadaceae bacterium]
MRRNTLNARIGEHHGPPPQPLASHCSGNDAARICFRSAARRRVDRNDHTIERAVVALTKRFKLRAPPQRAFRFFNQLAVHFLPLPSRPAPARS